MENPPPVPRQLPDRHRLDAQVRSTQPEDHDGPADSDAQAVARWEAMKWPSNVAFFDDKLLMHPALD